jgi:outer membrane receptor protein involved in Fe transport
MKKHKHPQAPRLNQIAALLATSSFTAMLALSAHAQSEAPAAAAAAPADKADALNLDRVVVTATSGAKSKLQSSVSVTTVDGDLVKAMNPQTQSEVLRLIPGVIDNGGNGPGGNANISVRGLPITTGGSPFVQLQEDGLPVVLFGDMNFGNNDYWIRFDRSNTIEAVRGGSASTLASGAPGAVVNYVSDTGKVRGGEVGIERGVGYDSTKAYFHVGGPVAEGLRYHAEGFLIRGAGQRDQGFNASNGYQIKANVTKDLGSLGNITFNLKALDDAEPLYTSYPALVTADKNGFSNLSPFPGFDSRTGSTVGVYNQFVNVLDSQSGQMTRQKSDGLHPKATAVGFNAHLTPGNDVTIDDKFRYTKMSGTFSTNFMGLSKTSSVIGSTVNGQTVGSIVYANGPNAGKAFTGTYLNSGTQIFTNMSDMGSLANDLTLSKSFALAGGKLKASGGVFFMDQTIAQDWHPNQHYQTLDGSNPAGLNLLSTTGQLLTLNGVSGYNTAWGAPVDRAYNISAADTAPYLNMNWENGPLQLDAGLRHDQLKVTGWAQSASAATTKVSTVNGALVSSSTLDPSTFEALNYTAHYNSYSLGALYLLDSNTSAFVRASRGGRFNVDRNILSGYTNADGSLTASGAQKAVSMVNQQEVGVKNRGRFGDASYSVNATLFHNTYSASNFDLTKGATGTYYESAYKSTGLELEGSVRSGGFGMVGNLTYTKARITANAEGPSPSQLVSSGVGNEPSGTPSLMWMLAPSYAYGDFSGGLMFVGRGKTNTNSSSPYWAPSQILTHLNLSWEFAPNATVGLNVHNLTNKQVSSGLDQGSLAGLQGNGQIGSQYVGTVAANNGRTTVLSFNYAF